MGAKRPRAASNIFGGARVLYDKDVGKDFLKAANGKKYANPGRREAARRLAKMQRDKPSA